MKNKLTPVEIATQAFEKDYVKDDEIQKRYNGFISARDSLKKRCENLQIEMNRLDQDIDNIRIMIIRRARKKQPIEELDQIYQEMAEEKVNVINMFNESVEEYNKNRRMVESYKNISDHRKMTAWTIISSLDPVLKAKRYPEWAKKYENIII